MTCNYYLHYDVCDKCKRPREVLHIGLSAVGWKFLFQFLEGKAEAVDQWKELTKYGEIYDESDKKVSYEEFWAFVDKKQSFKPSAGGSGTFDVAGYDFAKGDFS